MCFEVTREQTHAVKGWWVLTSLPLPNGEVEDVDT